MSTIRKLVAGYGNANKAHTARALSLYVGS